jgi:hypothetical protein
MEMYLFHRILQALKPGTRNRGWDARAKLCSGLFQDHTAGKLDMNPGD